MLNLGTDTEERVDYTVFGKRVADSIVSGEADLGILICGTLPQTRFGEFARWYAPHWDRSRSGIEIGCMFGFEPWRATTDFLITEGDFVLEVILFLFLIYVLTAL